MRIRTQFVVTMLLFGTILVVMAGSAIITQQELERADRQENLTENIAQGARELGYLYNEYLIYRESQQLSRWQSRFSSFSDQVASLNVETPEQQVLVHNIRANVQRLNQVFASVASAVSGSSKNQGPTLDLAFLQVSWSRMAVQSQGLVSDASRLSHLLHQQMDELTEARTALIYVMVGLFGALLLASYMLTHRRILKSLARLQAGTAVIGSGNLDFAIQEKKNDEIGDLSYAFNQMTANLKGVTASKTELEKEIAERKKAEEAIKESEEKYRSLFRYMSEGFALHEIILDGDGKPCDYRFLEVNDAFEKLTGISRTKALGRRVKEVLPDIESYWIETYGRVALSGEPVHYENYSASLGRWYEVYSYSPRNNHFAAVFMDITERKRAEAALKNAYDELEKRVQERTSELSKAVERLRGEIHQRKRLEDSLRESENRVRFFAAQCLTAQEAERKRVADELHDSIAASLGAVQFRIEKAAGEMNQGLCPPESLEDLAATITEINREVRRIMADLRPSILDDLGIIAAMNWFCREFEKTYSHISVEKHITITEQEVPESLKTPIFRIVQEAMNNIAKHTRANAVRLDLQRGDGRIELAIRDNGQGFDLDTARRGLGLSTMRERTQLSGGVFDLESAPGKGTRIRVSWPLGEGA
jgi:PAS domain S-box-containing protein